MRPRKPRGSRCVRQSALKLGTEADQVGSAVEAGLCGDLGAALLRQAARTQAGSVAEDECTRNRRLPVRLRRGRSAAPRRAVREFLQRQRRGCIPRARCPASAMDNAVEACRSDCVGMGGQVAKTRSPTRHHRRGTLPCWRPKSHARPRCRDGRPRAGLPVDTWQQ